MRAHLRLGRVAGIPVGLNLTVLVIFALLVDVLATEVLPKTVRHHSTASYIVVSALVAVLFLGALLAHELAHALVALHYGIRVKRITLWMLGGVAELADEPPTAKADFAVAVAGPLTSGVVGGISLGIAFATAALGGPQLLVAAMAWLGGVNVLLAAFNLLPGAPLDGGRVLRAAIWLRTGDRRRAESIATRTGRALGAGLIALGVAEALTTAQIVGGLWFVLIGWFLLSAATAEGRFAVRRELLTGMSVADVMSQQPPALPAWQPIDAALGFAVEARSEYFTVVDLDGRTVGLVTVNELSRLPPEARARHRVGDVARSLERLPSAAPGETVIAVLERTGGQTVVPVVDEGRLVGLLTPEDVAWAMRRSSLQRTGGS